MWETILSAVDVQAAEMRSGRNWTPVGMELGSLMETLGPMKWAEEDLKEAKVEDVEAISDRWLFVVCLKLGKLLDG